MADIAPFRAFRYDPDQVNLSKVVTQPYDKISPAMQEAYYAASPYNLVRIILGKNEPSDDAIHNVYSRAEISFRQWRHNGILKQDAEPSLYFYTQRFRVSSHADEQDAANPKIIEFERRGFIAAGRVQDYADAIVFRHEQTLAKPKADRLNLLRETRAHFGQIFMLYNDPAGEVDLLLSSATLTMSPGGLRQSEADAALATDPDISVTDEYGVLHRVWQISDERVVAEVCKLMKDKKLIIADGHHRYETALTYRNERRKEAGSISETAPYERVMMTFVNVTGHGLVILPTHRVVSGLKKFDTQDFLSNAAKFFKVEDAGKLSDLSKAIDKLEAAGKNGIAVLAVTRDSFYLLTAKPGAAKAALEQVPELQRQLDVTHLHKVLLENVLGISEESIRNQENISYHREAEDAVDKVRNGADVAFLMNPVRIEQLRDISFSGGVLPQKSTDFYPKLLSGLTIYSVE